MSRQRFFRLVTSKGWLLSDPLETIQSAGVQDGDSVTAVAQQERLAATQKAFAAFLVDGRVVGWGDPASGGHCSRVQNEVTNVHQIQSTEAAFSAILGEGRVYNIFLQMRGRTTGAFAAIVGDGRVHGAMKLVAIALPSTGESYPSIYQGCRCNHQHSQMERLLRGVLQVVTAASNIKLIDVWQVQSTRCLRCHPGNWKSCCMGRSCQQWRRQQG